MRKRSNLAQKQGDMACPPPLQVFYQLTQKDPVILPVVVAVLMTSFQAGFYRADHHLTVPWDGTFLGVFGPFLGLQNPKKLEK